MSASDLKAALELKSLVYLPMARSNSTACIYPWPQTPSTRTSSVSPRLLEPRRGASARAIGAPRPEKWPGSILVREETFGR
jgi:hypothetical protein